MGMKNLVYFEHWTDSVAEKILKASPDINLIRLRFGDSDQINRRQIAAAHGLHLLPALELHDKWYPTKALINECKKLLAISVTGAGYDIIDVPACTETGILVVNNAGANSTSVAQHVLGMMLALSKNMVQLDRLCRTTPNIDRRDHIGRELTGKTVGIIGLGNVGSKIAGLAQQGFDMQVIAYDPYISDSYCTEMGVRRVDFISLFRKADFVSVNCPLTNETKGMIDLQMFKLMKSDAFFITTARGGIHNEDALEEVLSQMRIAGAGLDVFNEEPPGPGHPLMKFNNVLMTPHVAGVTDVCNRNMAEIAALQWVDIMRGHRPPRLINPEVWPAYQKRYFGITGNEIADQT